MHRVLGIRGNSVVHGFLSVNIEILFVCTSHREDCLQCNWYIYIYIYICCVFVDMATKSDEIITQSRFRPFCLYREGNYYIKKCLFLFLIIIIICKITPGFLIFTIFSVSRWSEIFCNLFLYSIVIQDFSRQQNQYNFRKILKFQSRSCKVYWDINI